MKQQIEQLIDRLAKTVPCECPNDIICDCFFHGGLKVYLGDVLAEMDRIEKVIPLAEIGKFIDLWKQCGTPSYSGLQFSLQKIFDRAEWEPLELGGFPVFVGTPEENKPLGEVPKDPAIKALFEFLLQLKT